MAARTKKPSARLREAKEADASRKASTDVKRPRGRPKKSPDPSPAGPKPRDKRRSSAQTKKNSRAQPPKNSEKSLKMQRMSKETKQGPEKRRCISLEQDSSDDDDDGDGDNGTEAIGEVSVFETARAGGYDGPDDETGMETQGGLAYEETLDPQSEQKFDFDALVPENGGCEWGSFPSFETAQARGWITSTPSAARVKDNLIEIKVLISDGVGGRELVLRSDMTLHDVLGKVADVTRGSCVISRLGVEGPWCIKAGPNKYLPEYLDTQNALDKVFEEVRKHHEAQGGKKTKNSSDPKIILRNLPALEASSEQGKRVKNQPKSGGAAAAPLENAKNTFDKQLEEIASKIVANFTCDEHDGRLCARLKGMREHVPYTMQDVTEHAKLIVRGTPGVTLSDPPEALKLLDRRPLKSYSASRAAEKSVKTVVSAPTFDDAHSGPIANNPPVATTMQPSAIMQPSAMMQLSALMQPPFMMQSPFMMQPPGMMQPPFMMQHPLVMQAMLNSNMLSQRPRDFPSIAKWIDSLHEDLERGQHPCPNYRMFKESFESRGIYRLDDLKALSKDDLQEIATKDKLDVNIGLINRIHRYVEHDYNIIIGLSR